MQMRGVPRQSKGAPHQEKGAPQGPCAGARRAPRCGYFNVFARKPAILTKNDTFGHANEGGPAPREGGPAPGEGGPAGALRPLPPLPCNLAPALLRLLYELCTVIMKPLHTRISLYRPVPFIIGGPRPFKYMCTS